MVLLNFLLHFKLFMAKFHPGDFKKFWGMILYFYGKLFILEFLIAEKRGRGN